MSARINKLVAAVASVLLLVAAAPIVTAAGPGASVACQSGSCGG
jgi:hypothetical protein